MRALSSKTELLDPYRAGHALGNALSPLSPEVVFLFASIACSTPELLEGLYDALGSDDVIIIGNIGGGIYETSGITNPGAAALALNSDGRVRWKIFCAEAVDQNPDDKLREMGQAISADGCTPCLAYMAVDCRLDLHEIERFVQRDACFPIIGGAGGDDMKQRSCHLYANRRVLEKAVVLLAAYGDLNFSISVGNAARAIGRSGRIDHIDGKLLHQIDGMPADQFIAQKTGTPFMLSDVAVVMLKITGPDNPELQRLRTFSYHHASNGTLNLICGIAPGSQVQTCMTVPDDLLRNVDEIAALEKAANTRPVAALIVSCFGRQHLLGNRIHHEIGHLTAHFPELPLVGFPSQGEIAPLRRSHAYTSNLFHNMTYVLLLIGE